MRAKRTTSTDQTVQRTTVVNRWDRSLIVLAAFLFFVGGVLSGINVWQGTQRNTRIDHIDKVVVKAERAAASAERVLNAAINSPEAKQQGLRTKKALDQIEETNKLIKELKEETNK